MQVHEALMGYLEKLGKLPYKGILIVLNLAFVIALVLSMLMYRFVVPNFNQQTKLDSSASVIIDKEKPTLHQAELKTIVTRNIFNKTGEIPKEEFSLDERGAHRGDQAIKSELPLKVNGIIYGGTVTSGIALIENTEKKKQDSFMVGDQVTKDAVLKEIHERKVILFVVDHKEYIELTEPALAKGKRAKRKGAVGGSGKFGLANTGKYSEEGFERDGTNITMSADFRQKLLTTDFTKVLQDAKAEPVYEGGELNGFRLIRIRPDSVYEKGGLQNDDVVKEINGVSLVDTAQAIKLLNSLRGTSDISIGLNRGGKTVNVNIQVK